MKNSKQILTAMALLMCLFANATDRIVAYGGTGGAFSTITAAIAASSSGDRIIIYPSTVAFSENLTITTSLQLLSATEGQQWSLAGNITYNPSSAGQTLTISGGNLTGGNIVTGINAPTGARTKVNITGCKLASGHIDFSANYYDMNIASDSIMGAGYVSMASFGKVVGNYINVGSTYAHGIYIQSDGLASTDSVYIVGNKIQMTTYSSQATNGIYWNSTSQFYYIANNYITAGGNNQNIVNINNSKTSSAGGNTMLNNTMNMANDGNSWTLYVTSTNSPTFIFNNLLVNGGSGFYGLYAAASINLTVSYNHVSSGFNASYYISGFTNDGTNVLGGVNTIDNNTGIAQTGPALNGGNPDSTHVDLDLTRNDVGTGGGSYKFTNFHPMANLGAGARTTFMIAPRRIVVGQTFNIKGDGFDK
jgi:hypothetical protein